MPPRVDLSASGSGTDRILVLNSGSSGLKFAPYTAGDDPLVRLKGKIDRIGAAGTTLTFTRTGDRPSAPTPIAAADAPGAARSLLDWLAAQGDLLSTVRAVGHRIGSFHLAQPCIWPLQSVTTYGATFSLRNQHLPTIQQGSCGLLIGQLSCGDTMKGAVVPSERAKVTE